MAKLSARNRVELVRLVRESTPEPNEECWGCAGTGMSEGQTCKSCSGSKVRPSLCDWRRTTLALMSDRKFLSKEDVRFRSDGRKHSYGWKVKGKLKAEVSTERFVEIYTKIGYTRVK